MANIIDVFEKIEIDIYKCKAGERYFDPIRNIFLCITPEETVRQKMIVYLLEQLGVDKDKIFVEDHLIHYGVDNQNGRIDISILEEGDRPLAIIECKEPKVSIDGMQVFVQAAGYADAIGAKYIILVNGIELQFYRLDGNDYVPICEILTYEQMVEGKGNELEVEVFERYSMEQYFDIEFLKSQEWYSGKIGEDTQEEKIPAIVNFDDGLWDYSHKLKGYISDSLEVIEDLGINYMNYGDASGGGFGTGYYRLFLLNDRRRNKQFISGLSIISTGKTVNDSKYGNRDGLTVLAVCRNDGDYDETSVQINLNNFLEISNDKAFFTHNAAVTRKGASKVDAMNYIEQHVKGLIADGKVVLGEINVAQPIYVDNEDVKSLIGRIIEYSIYRDEYKHSL